MEAPPALSARSIHDPSSESAACTVRVRSVLVRLRLNVSARLPAAESSCGSGGWAEMVGLPPKAYSSRFIKPSPSGSAPYAAGPEPVSQASPLSSAAFAVKSNTSWPGPVRATTAGAFTASERKMTRGIDFMTTVDMVNRNHGGVEGIKILRLQKYHGCVDPSLPKHIEEGDIVPGNRSFRPYGFISSPRRRHQASSNSPFGSRLNSCFSGPPTDGIPQRLPATKRSDQ